MARVPADVAAALRELDAEVAALLRTWQQRDWLPSWLGLYRWTKPDGAEHVEVGWYHRYRLRYVVAGVPRSQGRPPRFHAMIGEDAKLDPTSRHLMRLMVAGQRGRRPTRHRAGRGIGCWRMSRRSMPARSISPLPTSTAISSAQPSGRAGRRELMLSGLEAQASA
jgi:hypothetical protein